MADFVSVLRRAVGNLESNTETARQAIYGKARAALRAQLEAIDPPLGPDEIARQIDSLDSAIVELEVEFNPQPTPQPTTPHEAFQSAVSESGALGAAAATAAREARRTLERIDHQGEEDDFGGGNEPDDYADRREPSLGAAPPPQPSPPQPSPPQPSPPQPSREAPAASAQQASPPARPAPQPAARPGPRPQTPPAAPSPASPARPAAPLAGSDVTPGSTRPVPGAELYDEDEEAGRGGSSRLLPWAILVLVLLGIAGVGFWQRDAVREVISSLGGSAPSDESADNGKIADRVPSPADSGTTEPTPAPTPGAPGSNVPSATTPEPAPLQPPPPASAEGERVAQALLLEESPGGVNPGNTLGGTVDWQLVDDTEAVGGPEKVIRGTVEVPERDLKVTVSVRRNKDQALPASHLIELVFQPGPGFGHGGIATIPGLLMKATPRSTGQPLVGAVVPVMDDYFLIGLSESDIDEQRNVQELTARDFIDIPVGYKDGGRAVLSLAKGEVGKRVFEEAFADWSQ